jgi:hypothetical protein
MNQCEQECRNRTDAIERKIDRMFQELDKLNGLEFNNAQAKAIAPALQAVLQGLHGILDVIGRSRL